MVVKICTTNLSNKELKYPFSAFTQPPSLSVDVLTVVAEPGGSSDIMALVLFTFSCGGFEEGARGWFAWSCSELARKLFTVSGSRAASPALRNVCGAESRTAPEQGALHPAHLH